MKRTFSLFLVFIFVLCMLPFSAASLEDNCQILDFAGLLTDEEINDLESAAKQLCDHYEMDVVIVTKTGLDGKSPQEYADNFYDDNGYGCGEARSGVLFLLDMENRNWYLSTCGDAIYAITDYGIQILGESTLPYLSEGAYYEAFDTYLTALPSYFEAYQSGDPIDGYADYSGDYYHGSQEEILYYEEDTSPSIFLSIVLGLVAASVTLLIMRASMNTKRPQRGASNYMEAGTFHLKRHRDIFLYSNVTKTRKQENHTSSGGGSSVHRSSGGQRHGGGGGKF